MADVGGDAPVRALPAASRFSLRIREGQAEGLGPVAGLPVDLPIMSCARAGERCILRLGPDEWLVIAPPSEADVLASGLAQALSHVSHSLVDISHRQVAFEVSGRHAADILNAGCPLDLHPSRFPPGSGTRTLLGKAEIVLLRPGDAPAFRVECWRSFASYLQSFLDEAASASM